MHALSDDELLFFGSLLTNFAYHPGSVHRVHFDSTDDLQGQNPNDKSIAQSSTLESIPSADADYSQLVLPDLPTQSIQLQTTTDTFDDFDRPLIKTKLPSHLQGIISGTRSALLKSNSSKWYRLKGCGNDTDGFLIKPICNSSTKLTIRGCAFLDTTHRELFMTHYISHLLSPHKIECANRSIGWFEYKSEHENTDRIHSDIPIVQDVHLHQWSTITRCCILLETLGNKRLSDHLLYGIEQLFSLMTCNDQSHPVNQSDLLTLFSVDRLTQSEHNKKELVPLQTWFASLTDILQPIDYQKCNWLQASTHLSDEVPSSIDEDRWRILWKTNIELVNNSIQTERSLADLLSVLYKRLGFECGSILGLMHYYRISWGTYIDELGTHCNAHPNNLVIKLSSSISSLWLAPLDFDMSFTETSYRPNPMNNQSFDELIQLELSGFQLTLGGDSQASSGVTAWIEMPDDQWTSARWLLRDIMLNEFNQTYNETIRHGSIKLFDSFSQKEYSALQALIRLALMTTMKEIG